MKRIFLGLIVIGLSVLQMGSALAPSEAMQKPPFEARARALYREVRCVVCQNESIADSTAAIASDMRRDIREAILANKTDTDIRESLIERYGDFVLFRPRFVTPNLILWLGPMFIIFFGIVAFFLVTKKQSETIGYALTDDEKKKLQSLIDP